MSLLADILMGEEIFPRLPVGTGRILICDDEGLTALRLQRVLTMLGYSVVGSARDGEAAIREASRLQPDVVLMDVCMPKLDGIEATQRIMQQCPTAVVMLTAYSDQELVKQALSAGASGYLVKPVADDQLGPAILVARERFVQLQQERGVASSLAGSFVCSIPEIPGFQVASRYAPASEVVRVGGDFFDVAQLANYQFGVVIGDVCGSGLPSAAYTAMVRHMLRAYSLEDPAPARVLSRLNRALCPQMSEECPFLTIVYGVLDLQTRAFTYANAGHPSPVLFEPKRQSCRELERTGGFLGAEPGMQYGQDSVTLEPGSVLALFTDGVSEARVGMEMLGNSGVCAVVQEHGAEPANSIAEAMLIRARQFAGGDLKDDVAIVVLRHE